MRPVVAALLTLLPRGGWPWRAMLWLLCLRRRVGALANACPSVAERCAGGLATPGVRNGCHKRARVTRISLVAVADVTRYKARKVLTRTSLLPCFFRRWGHVPHNPDALTLPNWLMTDSKAQTVKSRSGRSLRPVVSGTGNGKVRRTSGGLRLSFSRRGDLRLPK